MIIRTTPPTKFLPALHPLETEDSSSRVNSSVITCIENPTGSSFEEYESFDYSNTLSKGLSDCYDELTQGIPKKHRWKMLKVLQDFSDDRLPSVSQVVAPILKDVKDINQRAKILQTVAKIAAADQVPFLTDIRPFLDQLKSFQEKFSLICGVKSLAPEKRKIYLSRALPFISNQDSSFLQMELISKLQELESGTSEECLQLALSLMHPETCLKDRITLIEGVCHIPQNLRSLLCNKAHKILEGLSYVEHAQLLQAILSDAPAVTLKKLEIVSFLSSNLTRIPEKGKFLSFVLKSSIEKLELIHKISERFLIANEVLDPVFLLKTLLQLPKEDLYSFMNWLANYTQKETLIEIASYLNSVRIRFVDGWRYLVRLENLPPLQNLHLLFFMEYFADHEQNLGEVLDIALFIIEQHQSLGVDEDHPVFIKAFQISQLNESTDKGVLNPYNIFKEHIRLNQESSVIEQIRCNFSKQDLFFDPTQGLKRSREKTICSDQLPQNISAAYFSDKICGLNNRLEGLPLIHKQKILQSILTTTGLSFSQLMANLSDIFFESSLSFFAKKAKETPSFVVKLFQIVLWLESQDKMVKELGQLSQFEQALLETSACISNCPEGKRFGISRMYRLLPVEFQKEHKSGFQEDPLEDFLSKTVIPFFEKNLENHDWIKELLRPKVLHKVQELPHHVLFVKNRIAKFLGLSQSIQFDPYTGVLVKKILRISPKEMLDKFFFQLDFDELLATMVEGYKQLGEKEKNTLFNYFNEHVTQRELGDIWAEENDYMLTKKGALEMLRLSKLFTFSAAG